MKKITSLSLLLHYSIFGLERVSFNLVGYLNAFFCNCSVGGKTEVCDFFLYRNLAS